MVIVKIMGGLGNQMFQYALARKLQSMGKRVVLDTSYYDVVPEGDTVRKNWLHSFRHQFEETSAPSMMRIKVCSLLARFAHEPYVLSDRSGRFCPSVLTLRSGYVIGYWQSEKYFLDIDALLREDFALAPDSLKEAERRIWKEVMSVPNSVALHIRQGDYLREENARRFGGICTAEYYKKAVADMIEKLGNCKFFVFTDAPEEVDSFLPQGADFQLLSDGTGDEWFELFLMSQCKHHIIANSSFSWWGAWLNYNPDKIVIAPGRWTNDGDCEDIYCAKWIRIL